MKKIFYVAAAFLAAGFVSCSENNGDDFNAPVAGSDLAPIRFDLGSGRVNVEQKSAATRGAGAVGDLAGAENVWNGETLKVYMFEQGTLELAKDETLDGAPLFENADIVAGTGAAVTVNTQKYYPMQGNFDFFAYHVDDAANGPVAEAADVFTLPVKIDGSQDLMVAKAALQAGDADKLGATRANDYYSAFSARKGVNPHFTFEHLLTRFTFEVKAADDVDVANVKIKAVEVSNANTTADMAIAYTTAPASLLDNQANPATVYLKDANGATFTEKTPTVDAFERIGESLLLMPQAEYNMEFKIVQVKNGVEHTIDYPVTLSAAELGIGQGEFEAAKQYNVKFTLYGLSEIVLKLELKAWEDGGDINVDDNADVTVKWVQPAAPGNN